MNVAIEYKQCFYLCGTISLRTTTKIHNGYTKTIQAYFSVSKRNYGCNAPEGTSTFSRLKVVNVLHAGH